MAPSAVEAVGTSVTVVPWEGLDAGSVIPRCLTSSSAPSYCSDFLLLPLGPQSCPLALSPAPNVPQTWSLALFPLQSTIPLGTLPALAADTTGPGLPGPALQAACLGPGHVPH